MKAGLVVIATSLALAGCSSNKVLRGPIDVTIGQQLIDLRKAYLVGAMSKAEYDLQRSRLIDSVE